MLLKMVLIQNYNAYGLEPPVNTGERRRRVYFDYFSFPKTSAFRLPFLHIPPPQGVITLHADATQKRGPHPLPSSIRSWSLGFLFPLFY